MEIKSAYNGWSAKIRSVRGTWFYKVKPIESAGHCCLCDNTQGLTFHNENYGSTIKDFLADAKELCPYHHGMFHVRGKHPNRFRRMKARIAQGHPAVAFPNLFAFFAASNQVKDIAPQPDIPSGHEWLDRVEIALYGGPHKIALMERGGVLIPDPQIYGKEETVEGLRYDATTDTLTHYFHEP